MLERPPEVGPRRLPFGGEFSPGQVDLRELLRLAVAHDGDRAALQDAIRVRYFAEAAQARAGDPRAQAEQRHKRAGNVVIGMQQYGLIDQSSATLSALGHEMLADEVDGAMFERFARHIITYLAGSDVLDAVRALQRRAVRPSKGNL